MSTDLTPVPASAPVTDPRPADADTDNVLVPIDFPVRIRIGFDDLLLKLFHRCRPRVLIVTDGGNNFDPASGFGLSRMVEQLLLNVPAPIITTAHRGADRFAQIQWFRFDTATTPVTTAHYDQIWLFGRDQGQPAPDFGPEAAVITEFMNAGGGVFATGDHADIGFPLCGTLPRVRKMRDWQYTPMEIERIDTVTHPGRDRMTEFDDQSDENPQRIYPRYYGSPPLGSPSPFSPHPLLRSPLGDIDVLPDHAHESQCLEGYDLHERYQLHGLDLEEFPAPPLRGPLAPEIVAWSVSAGRYLNAPGTIVGKPPTTPRLFGAISVWDGQKVGAGRIVCDATWHHFVNINLDGTGGVSDFAGNPRRGFRDSGGAWTTDFHQIAEYFRNIVDWLIPVGRRWCFRWTSIVIQRYLYPLAEEWVPLPPHPCPWDPRVALGGLVESSLTAHRGNGIAAELAAEALTTAGLDRVAALVRLDADGPDKATDGKVPAHLVDPVALRRGVLGSVFDTLVRDLPADPADLPAVLGDGHDDGAIEAAAVEATHAAVSAAWDHYGEAAEHTLRFLEEIRCCGAD